MFNEISNQTYSVEQFCKSHNISRAKFYLLLKDHQAPAIMKIGRRTLISKEAAREWVVKMQNETQKNQNG